MLKTKRYFNMMLWSTLCIFVMAISGCVSHLDKGWEHFGKGEYQVAKGEWEQEEKEDLSEPIEKAVAAMAMVDLQGKALQAKEEKAFKKAIEHSEAIISWDRWENKDWLQKSPVLQQYITEAYVMVEESYVTIMTELRDKALKAEGEKDYMAMVQYAEELVAVKTDENSKWFEKYASMQALDDEGYSLIEKAYTTMLTQLLKKVDQAQGEKNFQKALRFAIGAIDLRTDKSARWFKRFPDLQGQIVQAYKAVEQVYFDILTGYKKQKYWVDLKKEFKGYEEFCGKYKQSISIRNKKLNELAISELKKREKLLADYDAQVECAKAQFLEENYDKSMSCVRKAYGYVQRHKDVKFNTDELDYIKQAAEQAIAIQKAIEEEKLRMAEAERKQIEEANRLAAEAERKLEEEKQRREQEEMDRAREVERKRLVRLAEARRKEAERKRKIEERNRRWRAFLKQGAPLKPLVTTVLKPSDGIGTLERGKRQKWQGGSQLPKPKDKSIAAEDVYALEVEVPKTHKLTYLRNYYKKDSRQKNVLKAPKTQGKKRSYYTENFKGGRYYTEVKNEKSGSKKYEIKARIYKIPVTF